MVNRTTLIRLSFIVIFCVMVMLLPGTLRGVLAQDAMTPTHVMHTATAAGVSNTTKNATTAPIAQATSQATAQSNTSPVSDKPGTINIPLTALNQSDIELTSPSGIAQFRFAIPDNWKIQGDNQLALVIDYAEMGQAASQNNTAVASQLKVQIDDKAVNATSLTGDKQGKQTLTIQLPTALLADTQRRSHTLRITFDAQQHCQINATAKLTVVASESKLHLEYAEVAPSLNLMDYPRPFYNHSFDKTADTVVLVLPANKTQADLDNAATVAAGLGDLSNNNVIIRAVTADQLTDQDHNSNLILIGQIGTNALIDQLYTQNKLPTQQTSGKITANNADVDKGDGIIQIAASPFNPNRAVLTVTGQTDEAVQKAAQALVDMPTSVTTRGPLTLVADFKKPADADAPLKTQFTFGDLGYMDQDLSVNGYGTRYINIDFNVPLDMRVADSATVDLKFGYSSDIKNARTTVSLLMNGTPFASKFLENKGEDTTTNAALTTPTIHAQLPINSIYPGLRNSLSIVIETQGDWGCFPPNQYALFFNASKDSSVTLPLYPADKSANISTQVSWFPSAFNTDSTLSDVMISLPTKPTADEFSEAYQIVARLGSNANGVRGLHPHINLGELPSGTDLANYHMIVIGRPSTNPVIKAINGNLPQPFAKDSDEFEQVLNNVSYRLAPGFALGVLQSLRSAWSPKHVVLVATGNNADGQAQAVNALLNLSPSQLRGDIVFVGSDNAVAAIDSVRAKQSAGALTAVPEVSTKAAQAATATVVALQATDSNTAAPTATSGPTETPTPLFTYTPSPTVPTAIPTYPPLPPDQSNTSAVVRPLWIDAVFGVTLLALLGFGLMAVIRMMRNRNSGARI